MVSHAAALTGDICGLFAGPHAAKRMARALGKSVSACESYLLQRRAISLDAAIEAAARNQHAAAALLARIEQARERNASDRRQAAAMAGGSAAGARGTQPGAGAADRELGATVVGYSDGVTRTGRGAR